MLTKFPPACMVYQLETFDWRKFLARCDLYWPDLKFKGGHFYEKSNRPLLDWGNSAFLGNGMMGACIYKRSDQVLGWELGRADVEAHNYIQGVDWGYPRVPIGDIFISARGLIASEEVRLCLYDAEAGGTIKTTEGEIHWRSFIHASQDVLIIEMNTSSGERNPDIQFKASHGISPRLSCVAHDKIPSQLMIPPRPFIEEINDIQVSVQTFVDDEGKASGECAVAWRQIQVSDRCSLFYCSIKNSATIGGARKDAVELVKSQSRYDVTDLELSHREWWHAYYPQSYVSLSDKYWEKFYWIQIYKLASATRGEVNIAIDNQGPWLTKTGWPVATWNLNVQLSYSPLYKANRIGIAGSLVKALSDNIEQLRKNALPLGIDDGAFLRRGGGAKLISMAPSFEDVFDEKKEVHFFEIGNLTWALFNVWIHYRSLMDSDFLKDKLFPLLRANMNVYLRLIRKESDGKWHLPKTTSPEYPGPNSSDSHPAYDVNYSLSLLKWLSAVLIESNEKLKLSDPLAERWSDVYLNLADYPCDESGLMIGKDVPLRVSHRHYSHLMAFYPLHLLDIEVPTDCKLAEKSFRHWISMDAHLKGYSFTGAACMAATLGDAELAINYLDGLKSYLLPNTMYMEGGGPVIETPIAAVESMHYMLLQCWGDTIRVFPAVPERWKDVSFAKLLAEGAFEMSGERINGENKWVVVKSLQAAPLIIDPGLKRFKVAGQREYSIVPAGNDRYKVDLKKGESICFYVDQAPDFLKEVQPPLPVESSIGISGS